MISPQDKVLAMDLIAEAVANGARKRKACEILGITIRSVQRWEQKGVEDERKHSVRRPVNRLSEIERERVVEILNSDEFSELPPSQIVPRLADKGEYIASESTMYRILRELEQNKHRQASKPRKNKPPKALTATGPNQIWSWDITYLSSPIRGKYWYLYLIMDIYSRKIVGWQVHASESAEYASDLIEATCLAEKVVKDQIVLHSDNGSPMKGSTMKNKMESLGIIASFSRPSVSNDNPYSESLFKTFKYRPEYPEKPFESLMDAREWVMQFEQWYNSEHLHSSLNFVSPEARHQWRDKEILAMRHDVYLKAQQKHPERWTGETRDWTPCGEVKLNPEKQKDVSKKQAA